MLRTLGPGPAGSGRWHFLPLVIKGRNWKMNVDVLRKQLEIDEGVVHEIYLDHLGLPTFGIGHLVLESDPEHGNQRGVRSRGWPLCSAGPWASGVRK